MDLISWIDLNETIFVYLALSSLRIFFHSLCFFSLSHDGRTINISTEYSIAIMVLFLEFHTKILAKIRSQANKWREKQTKILKIKTKEIELKWDKIFIWHFIDSLSMNLLCISSLKVSVTFNECNLNNCHFFECTIRIILWACKTKIPLIKTKEWLSWFELIILLTNHNFGHFNTI